MLLSVKLLPVPVFEIYKYHATAVQMCGTMGVEGALLFCVVI